MRESQTVEISTVKTMDNYLSDLKKSLRSHYKNRLIYPLNKVSKQTAEVLCLNNYEISIWQYKYLCLWKRDQSCPYILVSDFLDYLGFNDMKGFQDYFKNDKRHVSLDNFIPFLGIFAFFSLDEKIRIMMSISGIQSNINLSYDEVIKFLEEISSDVKDDVMVKIFLQQIEKNEKISMDDVLRVVHSSQTITSTFEKLQLSIVENFVGFKEYNTIKRRIKYYNNLGNSKVIEELPNEGCYDRIERLLTKKPPLYYTEYRTIHSNHQSILANFIYEIRREFGYCKRVDRESSNKMYLLPQSLSSKRLSHKSAVTPQTSNFRSATNSSSVVKQHFRSAANSSSVVKPIFSPKIYPLPSDDSPF